MHLARPGWPDRLLSGIADALLALPGLLLVLIVLAIVPGTATGFWIGLSLVLWVEFFRLARAATREILASPAVEASRLLGFGPAYLFRTHLWPEIAPMMLTAAAFGTATAIMGIAALGFVSVGMRAPQAELGLMMVELLPYWHEAPLAILAPVFATFALLLGLTLIAGSRGT
nr:ABC transporter permease subunit [Mangrovicoccus ximenensis]